MQRADRQRVRALVDEVTQWQQHATALLETRRQIVAAADDAARQLTQRIRPVGQDRSILWHVLSLTPSDDELATAMGRARALPVIPAATKKGIEQLQGPVARSVSEVAPALGARRFFSGRARGEAATAAAARLEEFHARATAAGLPGDLHRLGSWRHSDTWHASSILHESIGFARTLGSRSELLEGDEVAAVLGALDVVDRALRSEPTYRTAVVKAGDAVRRADTARLLGDMPVERLKDATSGQLRISALVAAGITTVAQVLQHEEVVHQLPGVGEKTGDRMIGAARTLWQTTYDETPVRIDFKKRTLKAKELLAALRAWETARDLARSSDLVDAVERLRAFSTTIGTTAAQVAVVPGSRAVQDLRRDMAVIIESAAALGGRGTSADIWEDFESRPADYFAMLSELGLLPDDEEKSQGDLPDEIVDAVRSLTLDTSHLNVSLRGYQSFAARFAVVQRKVIIGDEMGLGKTVESLAVLTHLRAKGEHHFLVVCPAAVVTNWVREIANKSDLRAHRLHGSMREAALSAWIRNGGVGVTTYDTLGWLDGQIPERALPACLVFDEAHYIKNPAARRSRRSVDLIDRCERTVLLTGTPLENRVDEFRQLVGYLRPDLAVSATDFAPRQFRKQVAPAYLRRNQEDVLTELPETVEVDEWLPFSDADAHHYREAVLDGNFMAMRQAALRAGPRSAKMQRILDLVEEAEDNGRRVLVFSHFRNALEDIAALLPGKVFGPLTGSVPAAKRQSMVDEFSQAPHGAVLVAQIVAGGVGLNVQAASVVIICEPQLKPTVEWQAIARARRMGQLESVQVHRLLSEEGVDVRIKEILAQKSELFAEFARVSETAASTPEAVDISDAEIARQIVADERERVLGS